MTGSPQKTRRHRSTPAARSAYRLLADDPFILSGQYYFWDPLAAAIVGDPALGSFRDRNLLVTASLDAGAGWIIPYAQGPRIRVTTDVDQLAFERVYLTALAGAPVRRVRPDPDLIVTFRDDGCRLRATGPIAPGEHPLVFRNRSDSAATAIIAGFGGTTTYGDLLEFIGPPGSTVVGAPHGFHPIGSTAASPGNDAWIQIFVHHANLTAACAVTVDGATRVWPGGALLVAP